MSHELYIFMVNALFERFAQKWKVSHLNWKPLNPGFYELSTDFSCQAQKVPSKC